MTPRAYAAAQALAQDPNATPAERANAARRCAEYEAIHGRPTTTYGKRPWWTLKIALKDSPCWLSNDREFRRAVRGLRDGTRQREYVFEWATVKAVQDGGVDWVWFPELEPWRAPREMLRVYDPQSLVGRFIERDQEIVQWPEPRIKLGTPRKRRTLRDGELPGRRKTAKTRRKAGA